MLLAPGRNGKGVRTDTKTAKSQEIKTFSGNGNEEKHALKAQGISRESEVAVL